MRRATLASVAVSAAAFAAPADAQIGSGFMRWEASVDDGSTWIQDHVAVGPGPGNVLVRLRAQWTPDAGGWFAAASFDSIVSGPAGNGDDCDQFLRPPNMVYGGNQTIVATRFGSTIKIDDERDTLAPGAGPRGVFPAQDSPEWNNSLDDNPIELFRFRLVLDGSLGDREVSGMFRALGSDMNTTDRLFRVYAARPGGGFGVNTPASEQFGLVVSVVPAPVAGVPLVLVSFALAGRRRRGS